MNEGELGKVYSDGEIIFKEGDVGEGMYVIQSGKINITKKATSGELVIATLQSGEIFGEMALFDRLPRSATAKALGDARVLSIDKKKLFSTISKDPTLAFKILESMSQKIRRLNEEFMKLKKDKLDILQVYLDVDAICNFILEEAKKMIPADNGSVMLLDDEDKTLSIKAAFGSESDHKIRLTVGEGVAGDVLRTGKAELINNVSLDSRFKPMGIHIKSMLCVPLKLKNYNFGVINMTNSSEKYFAIDDLKLLHSIAIHASIAIENAKNFSKLKSATDEIIMHATLLDMG
jgi:transcriptional regulator with GAF, ATPase, and Fis domain